MRRCRRTFNMVFRMNLGSNSRTWLSSACSVFDGASSTYELSSFSTPGMNFVAMVETRKVMAVVSRWQ